MDYYSSTQKNTIDRDNRQMQQAGFPMSGELTDLRNLIATGPIGIQSAAADIDSLALGGGAFTVDPDTSTGLTFGYDAGRFHNGFTAVSVAAGTLALAASATNYVELDRNGTVSSNTTTWTAGRMPLYLVVTGVAYVTTTISVKALITLLGPASVTGAMLSAAAGVRMLQKDFGSLTATFTSNPIVAPVTGKLSAATLIATAAAATSDATYWTFAMVNLGQANAGTQPLLAATSPNTTKATGGVAFAANTPRPLTLTAVTTGTELNVTAGDVLQLTATATGAAPTLSGLVGALQFTFTA